MKLSINQCPRHPKYWMVSIDDEHGGTRVTRSKCCGSWREIASFDLTASDWQEIAELATKAAKKLKKAEKAR